MSRIGDLLAELDQLEAEHPGILREAAERHFAVLADTRFGEMPPADRVRVAAMRGFAEAFARGSLSLADVSGRRR